MVDTSSPYEAAKIHLSGFFLSTQQRENAWSESQQKQQLRTPNIRTYDRYLRFDRIASAMKPSTLSPSTWPFSVDYIWIRALATRPTPSTKRLYLLLFLNSMQSVGCKLSVQEPKNKPNEEKTGFGNQINDNTRKPSGFVFKCMRAVRPLDETVHFSVLSVVSVLGGDFRPLLLFTTRSQKAGKFRGRGKKHC